MQVYLMYVHVRAYSMYAGLGHERASKKCCYAFNITMQTDYAHPLYDTNYVYT